MALWHFKATLFLQCNSVVIKKLLDLKILQIIIVISGLLKVLYMKTAPSPPVFNKLTSQALCIGPVAPQSHIPHLIHT